MPRLSIEVSEEQHQAIKANAVLNGQTLKEFVVERALQIPEADLPVSQMSEQEAMSALKAMLMPRIERARRGETITTSFEAIAKKAKDQQN